MIHFLQMAGLVFVVFFGFLLNGIFLAKNKKNILIFYGLALLPASIFLALNFSFSFLLTGLGAFFLFLWLSAHVYQWVERRFDLIVADFPFFPKGVGMGIYLMVFHWIFSAFLLWRLVAN